MGYEFSRRICRIESKRRGGIWLIALVLASVLAVQYIDRRSILSLLPSGKFYAANFNRSSPSPPSPSFEKLRLENSPEGIAPSPHMIISPSVAVRDEEIIASEGNAAVAPLSPSSSTNPLPPAVSPSPSSSFVNMSISSNSTSDQMNAGESQVVSLSAMTDMLRKSRASSYSKSPLWPTTADQELRSARFSIEYERKKAKNPGLYSPVYRNLTRFLRSYETMEQKLKIYVYRDGKRPIFHSPRLKGIYASEGWFMKHVEASERYLTRTPAEAHLFYLPFSSQLLVDYVYVKDSHAFDDINRFLADYLRGIESRYAFWNRTDGSDHFLVACHDWAPVETRELMKNAIRAMCNADVKEGFRLGKDVSLPETYVHSPDNPMRDVGGNPPSKRKILGFFAGQMHGYVRPVLLKHWANKDPDMRIFGRMKKGYQWHMKNSKYCVCAKGYEVNSPRVVEAILYGCVPVIISDNFVPPFFEVLEWETFAVFVREKDIPDLKKILASIPEGTYRGMYDGVEKVRRHFMWHRRPVKYDVFHMILHSVWYNRVFMVPPA